MDSTSVNSQTLVFDFHRFTDYHGERLLVFVLAQSDRKNYPCFQFGHMLLAGFFGEGGYGDRLDLIWVVFFHFIQLHYTPLVLVH